MAETASCLRSSQDEGITKFVYTFDEHLKVIQNHLYCQWTEGTFCDLELQTFDGYISVHAWLFACFSPKIASVLNESAKDQNSKKPGVFSLDILFTYDVVKAIVEAIYSGIFTATLQKLGELKAALQWLEMHELLAVVKYIQDKAEKENLIAQVLPLDDSVKSNQPNKLGNTQNSEVCTRIDIQGPQTCKLVSLIKNMPALISHKKNSKCMVSDESKASHENVSREKGKEMSADLLPSNNEHHPEPPYDTSLELENSSYMDSLTPQIMSPSTKIAGVFDDKEQRESIRRKKCTKQAKARGRQSQFFEEEESQVNKVKSQMSNRCKRKSSMIHPQLYESALENLSTDIESVQEKEKDATKELKSIGRNRVKGEIPEVETFEAVNWDEMDQGILRNDSIKCDKCCSYFTNLDEYNRHVENHPAYICDKCSMVHFSRKSFIRHVRGAHLKSMHLTCSKCDFTARDDTELKQHCAKAHEEFRPFKCLFKGCKFQTTKYQYLSTHFKHHEDKNLRTCVCENCHKTFKSYDHLYSHKRSCYHVQKYLCDMCGQSFNHHTSMKLHRSTMHFGEKPYSCKVCQKSFSNGANLRRHMRIHNNSFPYSCHICIKQFRHSNTLKLHIRKHEEAADKSPFASQTKQSEVCTSNSTSFHHQPNSSF